MNHDEYSPLPKELHCRDWLKEIPVPGDEEKVDSEFELWWGKLRNLRLAEKAGRLWRLFKSGKLSGFDKAIVIAALLYCISPIDVSPDFIPIAGYVDDLLVVLGVLTYLDGKAR